MGQTALAHLRALNAAVANVVELERALGEAFAQHPDATIITSFPGLGRVERSAVRERSGHLRRSARGLRGGPIRPPRPERIRRAPRACSSTALHCCSPKGAAAQCHC